MKKSLLFLFFLIFCMATQGVAQENAEYKEAHHGKSADELAKELNNPNNSIAKLTFKSQYRWYEGSLPGADDQDNYTLLFQPVFPFSLGGKENHKNVLFVRPAFPILFDQPVPQVKGTDLDWKGVTAMGDISFDVAYGRTYKSGWLWAAGMLGTVPTATDSDVAGKQWRAGPEAIVGYIQKWGLLALFPYHQWDVAGWAEKTYSTTNVQTFAMLTPGGGWAVGTQPIMSYNWQEPSPSDRWTIPLNLFISKTIMMGKLPLKIDLDLNYYVEKPRAFGPEWMVGINITPIVPNFIDRWIRGS